VLDAWLALTRGGTRGATTATLRRLAEVWRVWRVAGSRVFDGVGSEQSFETVDGLRSCRGVACSAHRVARRFWPKLLVCNLS
jgi:hypothetical protein